MDKPTAVPSSARMPASLSKLCLLAICLLFAPALWLACATARPIPTDHEVVDELRSAHAPVKGRADAPVTIQEFSNFTCPFCRRAQETLHAIEERWPDDVRFVARQLPLAHQPRSEPAARAALAAHAQGAYWQYADLLFQNMRALEDLELFSYATSLGLDAARLEADMYGEQVEEWLAIDREVAEAHGLRGTPSFLVNGRLVRGAQPLEVFAAVIEEELDRARSLERHGMPRSTVSLWLTGENLRRALAEAEDVDAAARRPTPSVDRPQRPPDPPAFVPVGFLPEHPRRGAPEESTLVTLVVFTNYECGFCARLEGTFDQLLQRWPDTLQIVYRHRPIPLRKNAALAAEAVQEANAQGLFEPFQRLLHQDQRRLEREDLLRYAAEAGLDVPRFETALEDGRHRALVQEDDREAQEMGVRGTPTSFVNGRIILGAQPLPRFEESISAEMRRAEEVSRETGLRGRQLYERILELGRAD